MSKKLTLAARYQNPIIRTHLASQYALGTLTSKVQQRVTHLMLEDELLVQEVYQWQNRLEPINHHIDDVKPPQKVWRQLSETLAFKPANKTRWWQSLVVWQCATAFSLTFTLSLFMWQTDIDITTDSPLASLKGPSYLAILAPNTQLITSKSAIKEHLPELIITAYKSPQAGQSELHIQWNKNAEKKASFELDEKQNFTLWSIDKSSGKQVSLGSIISVNNKQRLTLTQWKLIKNSKELWLTRGNKETDPVVFKGECLQLSSWETS
ncbi:hypothetical protein A9Q77_06860 [Marinomonas sp. 42_23_T18]|nr:hypothetical protein A9Q77_06860 [Marinomonas sp. 42_23_T18]